MAWDVYLLIDDGKTVKGESKRDGHVDEIELDSFSVGGSNPSSVGQGSGGGAGKVTLQSLSISKKTDAASTAFFKAMCTGAHFKKAKLTMFVAGGAKALEKLVYEFEEVFVESMNWSAGDGGGVVPSESLSLAFGKISVTYKMQNPDGTDGGSFPASWDVRTALAGG